MPGIVTLTVNPSIDLSTSIDKMMPMSKLRCAPAHHDPGGGGINVARVVTRLGADVKALYTTGGAMGQLLRRLMDGEGISSVAIPVAQEIREDVTVFEESTGHQYRFVFPGPTLSEAECQALLDTLGSLKGEPEVVVASGSLPPGVPTDFYAQVTRIAKALGARVVLDTSGPALQSALEEGVYLFKPNLRELTALVGAPLDDEAGRIEACRRLVRAARAEVVALTLAEEGGLLVTHEQAWRARPLPITPVSVVGAGDSFVGAFVWSLVAGHDLADAFRYGIAGGSGALLRHGNGLCHKDDVMRLYADVVVEEVR